MKIKFSEKSIKALAPKAAPYEAIDIQLPGFLVRVQPTGRRTFYYSYKCAEGRRGRLKLGRHGDVTLSQAREFAKSAAGEVAKGKDPQAEKRLAKEKAIRSQALTLRVYIQEHYEAWVLKHNKRGHENIETLHRCFAHLLDKPMVAITSAEVEKWQVAELARTNRQGNPLKPASVNRRLTCLRAVFSRALATKHVDQNPLSSVKNLRQEDDAIIRYLTSEEESCLYQALRNRHQEMVAARLRGNRWRTERGRSLYPEYGKHDYVDHIEPMILLAINTGLRKGEIFMLQWHDVDFDRKLVTVRAANAKSRKVRHVNLNQRAMAVLSTWKNQQSTLSGWVFKNRNGNRYKDIKKAWSAVLKTAGITNFRFHDLRHHFASQLVMRGVPLNTVRELLGHADLGTTLRYAHLAQDHKAEAVELLLS